MKKFYRSAALIMAAVLAAEAVPAGAVSFDDLDAKTAVAGASYALEAFLYSNADARDRLSSFFSASKEEALKKDEETLTIYDEVQTGKVTVGSVLNIRKEPSTASEIVGSVVLGKTLSIAGEKFVNGSRWYYVILSGCHGYASAKFITPESFLENLQEKSGEMAFDDGKKVIKPHRPGDSGTAVIDPVIPEASEDASFVPEETKPEVNTQEEPEAPAPEETDPGAQTPEASKEPEQSHSSDEKAEDDNTLPTAFELGDDASKAGESVFNKLTVLQGEINYCLRADLPPRLESGDSTACYAVVTYILQKYQEIAEIAAENGMDVTFSRAIRDIDKFERLRTSLSEQTGKSEHDFYEEIRRSSEEARLAAEEAARQQAAAEEATRLAEEAARQAEEAARAEQEDPEAQARAAEEAAARQAAAEEAARQAEEAHRRAREAAEQGLEAQLAVARAEGAGTLGREIADLAAEYVGWLPYIWGGASLSEGADCSGFVGQIMAKKGLLDQARADCHSYDSAGLRHEGYAVPLSDIRPGDVVCYHGHVAIYYGNGLIVHEPSPGKTASYASVYVLDIITVRRMY